MLHVEKMQNGTITINKANFN